MGTVLLHAGMPKTGSTSVQEWIRRHATALRDTHGIQVVIDHAGPVNVEAGMRAFDDDPFVVSNRFLLSYYGGHDHHIGAAALEELCAGFVWELDEAAKEFGQVLVTSEGFARPLSELRPDYLAALEELAQRHTVRFVYYVRPQHLALESFWRQWGYVNHPSPKEWIESQTKALRFGSWLAAAQAAAPSVQFEVRPFRRDLLVGNDVVVDFATNIIGAPELAEPGQIEANLGITLDLAILLHCAPAAVIQTPEHLRFYGEESGRRQVTLAAVTADWDLPASAQAERAQIGFQSLAHQLFAAENAELIAAQGWDTDAFIPPVESSITLDELDQLLRPQLDPAVLAHFHRSLADLCVAYEERTSS